MPTEQQLLNPPKCRKCGHTICPTVWACANPQCVKNQPTRAEPHPARPEPSQEDEQ